MFVILCTTCGPNSVSGARNNHSNAVTQYHPSSMILRVHGDAFYLLKPKVRSRAGGYFYLGNHQPQQMNGPILVLLQTLRNVMVSAAEVELGALFENAKEVVSLHTTLNELGHQQAATPIQVDNSTAHRILDSNIHQRKSKAVDMHFYWIKDKVKQERFKIYWGLGRNNRVDYFTKHHPPAQHKKACHEYLNIALTLIHSTLQGCAKLSPTQDKSNPEIAGQDYGQSTRFMSVTSLAIGLVGCSCRQLKPMTNR
eukprot:13138053-Ditylum_brightwellii.AAC.1